MRATRTEATLADGSAAETEQALAARGDVYVEVSVTSPDVPDGALADLLPTVLGRVHPGSGAR